MSDLQASRLNIQLEESQFRAAVSEGSIQKIGSSINFINKRQYDTKSYFINGPYDATGTGTETGIDGLYVCAFDMEIFGIIMFNLVAGSSGTTELDLHRLTAPNTDAGSIFSTTPAIASTAAAQSYVGFSIADDGTSVSIGGGTGMTAPVLSTRPFQLDQGDALRLDFVQRMTGAENCGLHILMRPR